MWMIDADAHYIVPVSITASLYPIAGIIIQIGILIQLTKCCRCVGIEVKHRPGANLGLGFST